MKIMKKHVFFLEIIISARDPRTKTDWSRTEKNFKISDRFGPVGPLEVRGSLISAATHDHPL